MKIVDKRKKARVKQESLDEGMVLECQHSGGFYIVTEQSQLLCLEQFTVFDPADMGFKGRFIEVKNVKLVLNDEGE